MNSIFKLIISILPVYLIALYIYKKDKDKESRKLLSKLFIFGMISCIPASIMEIIFSSLFGNGENISFILLFIYVILGVAFMEEICKWFCVYKIAYNHDEFNHAYDALVYCVFVSLGFACLENVLYVYSYGFITGILRAFTAIPGHACDAIIMGNYLSLAKIDDINHSTKSYRKNLLLSIVMPVLFHGIYDFCLFYNNTLFLLVFIIYIVFIYIFSIRNIKKISSIAGNFRNSNSDNIMIKKLNFCPKCGTKRISNFCTICGYNFNLNINKINDDNNLTH